MIRKFLKLFLLLAALFLFHPARAGADTTVMLYMCGSNLETLNASATMDLLEIQSSGFDPDEVHIIALLGGSRSWASGYESDRLHLVEIRPKTFHVLETPELMSMGDPETLSYLLEYAPEHFPADRYALILWDHGGGPMDGLCWDENFSMDVLTLSELTSSLEHSMFASQPLEWIGFDACLMASAEVALQLSPYAGYMIASEENEPDTGWNYMFLHDLGTDADGLQTGQRIVRTYVDTPADEPRTLSVLSLRDMPQLMQAFDGFFAQLKDTLDRDSYSAIALLRRSMRSYGPDVSRKMADHDLVDLLALTRDLTSAFPDRFSALAHALEKAVVFQDSTDADCAGLSVYFPYYNREQYTETWKKQHADESGSRAYADYIRSFGEILTGEPLADWSGLEMELYAADAQQEIPPGAGTLELHSDLGRGQADDNGIISVLEEEDIIQDGILARTRLTPEQQRAFASARLIVMERLHTLLTAHSQYRMVYTSPALDMDADGYVRAPYQEQTLYVVNEDGDPLAWEISYQTLDSGDLSVPVIARTGFDAADSEELQLIMTFRDQGNTLVHRNTYVHDPLSDTYTRRIEYDPEAYPYLVFPSSYMQSVIQEDGSTAEWTESTAYRRETVIPASELWHLEWRTLSNANALVMYLEITDTQNRRHITPMRTLAWGYSAPDLLADSGVLRVLLENMQVREGFADMSLTFLTSDEAEIDLGMTDMTVNGKETGFSIAGSSMLHLRAGSAETRVISVPLPDSSPLETLSFRFHAHYDSALEDSTTLENGRLYVNMAVSDTDWNVTDLVQISPAAQPLPSEIPVLLSGADLSILPAHFLDGYDAVLSLNAVSPLDAMLQGTCVHVSVSVLPPDPACRSVMLLSGTLQEQGGMSDMRISRMQTRASDGQTPVSFTSLSAQPAVLSGGTFLPLLMKEDDFVPVRLTGPGEQAHELSGLRLSSGRISFVQWTCGDFPVELSDSVLTEELHVRFRRGGQVESIRTSAACPAALPLQLVMQPVPDRIALFLDAQGRVLDCLRLTDSEIHGLPSEDSPFTQVDRMHADGITRYVQEGPFIARMLSSFEAELAVYAGQDAYVSLPETIAGHALTSIGMSAFGNIRLQELTLPASIQDVHPEAFMSTELSLKAPPLHGTLRLPHLPASVESVTDLHELWKFSRVYLGETQTCFQPPLVFRALTDMSWEVLACSPNTPEVTIPASFEGMPVTGIAERAFCRPFLSYVQFLQLPDTLKRIGKEAFLDSSLTEINLPSGLEELGPEAFSGCGMLRHVRLDCDPSLIGPDTFRGCPLLSGNPAGFGLPAGLNEAEARQLFSLPEAGGAGPVLTPEDTEAFLGTWYGSQYLTEGKVFQIVAFSVTFYENGTYNGTSLTMTPMNGHYALTGSALETPDGTFQLTDAGELIFYMNHARLLCTRDRILPSADTEEFPSFPCGLWYCTAMTENGETFSALSLNLKMLLDIEQSGAWHLWGLSDRLVSGTLAPSEAGFATDLFELAPADGSLILSLQGRQFTLMPAPDETGWEALRGSMPGSSGTDAHGPWKAWAALTMGIFSPASVSPFPLDCELLDDGSYRIYSNAGTLNSGTWTEDAEGLQFSDAAQIPLDSTLLILEIPSSILFFIRP